MASAADKLDNMCSVTMMEAALILAEKVDGFG
jgi:hypothetical protein